MRACRTPPTTPPQKRNNSVVRRWMGAKRAGQRYRAIWRNRLRGQLLRGGVVEPDRQGLGDLGRRRNGQIPFQRDPVTVAGVALVMAAPTGAPAGTIAATPKASQPKLTRLKRTICKRGRGGSGWLVLPPDHLPVSLPASE